ncbi:MAG: AbrB/MazE/SpoVT family DNA-binding domain-containing protein [Lachnospiraceae bacterium]|jgi:AbrB family looped-hinge helix DNA binding protein|nr:AbrB/MazE/SpoVT family DNA-binding domain-containing protein [Lachnospiraceae bacterium]MCH4031761.1 AbrB/MazE/SpoVT family DNA-binding domain-containing protein [Lachnospiraceae bacterium]MCH4108315.1 AbrB/MazE/SpoVT family DNA-binding domain-containing protein [Lachnospiraceae bacterium]MCI1302633.1 AbrB/MazE/SpoVT family DNA-binding domain-containing protein [Lachnospiraceae bacterium]MCI1331753.1 AbrB/MazE/SpoVT family DNA-binding domain-containing protein [Lachnospiraceae bacterium]
MDILKVSSKGQISIPAKARKEMNIKYGDRLAYIVFDDTLVIKPVKMPSEEEFKKSLDEAQSWAASVGLTENDINDAIKEVRKEKHG